MKNELSAQAQALLEGARRAGGPSLERRAHLTASVMTATGGGPAPGAPGGSALKLFGGWAVAGLVAVGGLTLLLRQDTHEVAASRPALSAAQPPAAPALAEPAAPEVAAREDPAPVPAPVPARRVRPVAPPGVAPVAVAAPEEEPDELTSLDLSLAALDDGRAQDALHLARRARVRFPEGAVRAELTLAEVLALCALGQHAEASAVAGAMPAVDLTSLVSEKLQRSCVGSVP